MQSGAISLQLARKIEMWGGLDLGKLGEAFEKVRKEVDQAVDTALGLEDGKPTDSSPPEGSSLSEADGAGIANDRSG